VRAPGISHQIDDHERLSRCWNSRASGSDFEPSETAAEQNGRVARPPKPLLHARVRRIQKLSFAIIASVRNSLTLKTIEANNRLAIRRACGSDLLQKKVPSISPRLC
jgi:hypothetical protein